MSGVTSFVVGVTACGAPAPDSSTPPPPPSSSDAGVEAGLPALPSCRDGGRSGEIIADLGNADAFIIGANKGVLFFWTPLSHEIWRMALDGSDRRVIGLTSEVPVLGDDGIYFAEHAGVRDVGPIRRIPLDGGQPMTISSYDDAFNLFAIDDANVYAETRTSVWRIPKDGSPPIELAPSRSAGGERLGDDVMWLNRADFLGHIDPRGDAMPEIQRVTNFGCSAFAVGRAGAACEHDGRIDLVDASGNITMLIPPSSLFPTGYLAPAFFARHQGVDGLVFVPSAGRTSEGASVRWISLDGRISKELTCGAEQLAADGDDLFMVADAQDTLSRRTRVLVRVDLR